METKITTLYELADYINESEYWPSDVETIIEDNGWNNLCHIDDMICSDNNGNHLFINENGEAEVR